jgi:hypothetical protein
VIYGIIFKVEQIKNFFNFFACIILFIKIFYSVIYSFYNVFSSLFYFFGQVRLNTFIIVFIISMVYWLLSFVLYQNNFLLYNDNGFIWFIFLLPEWIYARLSTNYLDERERIEGQKIYNIREEIKNHKEFCIWLRVKYEKIPKNSNRFNYDKEFNDFLERKKIEERKVPEESARRREEELRTWAFTHFNKCEKCHGTGRVSEYSSHWEWVSVGDGRHDEMDYRDVGGYYEAECDVCHGTGKV